MPATCQPIVVSEERAYVSNVHAPHAVRRFVRWQLLTWGLEPLTETAELVASELVTNAVQNSLGDVLAVRLECSGGSVCIRVWDDNPDMPRMREPGSADENGRGLAITDAVSGDWGAYRLAKGGKIVWALITG